MTALRPGGFFLTDRLLSQVNISSKSRVLDIGCGEGETLAYISTEHGCSIFGVEPDPAHLELARAANPAATIIPAVAEELPFDDDSFDIVLAECVFSLSSDMAKALREAHRVLIKGGMLLMSDVCAKNSCIELGSGMIRHLRSRGEIFALVQSENFSLCYDEDADASIKSLLGQMIFDYGREEAYHLLGLDACSLRAAGPGYFLLAAEAI